MKIHEPNYNETKTFLKTKQPEKLDFEFDYEKKPHDKYELLLENPYSQ
jgi:hypothetical protein